MISDKEVTKDETGKYARVIHEEIHPSITCT